MVKLKKPTKTSVKRSVASIKSNPKSSSKLKALKMLFTSYPKNNKLEEVYIKVVALNEMYSTNIYNPYKMALGIVKLDIDKDLKANATRVVNKIAKSHSLKTASGSKWNFYSFATKYCSWHIDDFYPIYDSYVSLALTSYRNSHKFHNFKNGDLKNYKTFSAVIDKFQSEFGLSNFSLREIDNFLWKKGKDLKDRKQKNK